MEKGASSIRCSLSFFGILFSFFYIPCSWHGGAALEDLGSVYLRCFMTALDDALLVNKNDSMLLAPTSGALVLQHTQDK